MDRARPAPLETPTPGTQVSRDTAVFTIVAKNYLPYARVLMRSVAEAHPSWSRFVLLADRVDGYFDPADEPFEVLGAETLPIPDFPRLSFRYTILEFNTAVKPWFFRHLFEAGFDRVVYLDPDIYVYQPLTDVDDALGSGVLAVLVPHLTGRLLDAARPTEHEILQSGAYNLGFCAIGRHPATAGLLDFWCQKSLRDFVVDLPRGLFTDQRWMDLVPGMFPDVRILRHPGYDVAYWNLPHRRIEATDRGYRVNGMPLVFFHFSGVQPDRPQVFSKHQDRYSLGDVGPVARLVREYGSALMEAGYDRSWTWPYAYGALRDGTRLPDVLRKLYRTQPAVEEWAGDDPFARTASEWCESVDDEWPPLTRVMLGLYQARPDLRLAWPDVEAADREAFARWFTESSEIAAEIPPALMEPVRASLGRSSSSGSRPPRPIQQANMTPKLARGALRKAYVALRERRLPLSPARWLHLLRLHRLEHAQEQAARGAPPLPAIVWPGVDRRHLPLGYSGFHPQSTEDAASGVAWMGRHASIRLAAVKPRDRLAIRGRYITGPLRKAQRASGVTLTLEIDGVPLLTQKIDRDGHFELSISVPEPSRPNPTLSIRANPVFIPAETGLNDDRRELSVQIERVTAGDHPLLDFRRAQAIYQPAAPGAPSGLTIVGYLTDGTGVSAGAHASVLACEAAGIPCEILDARPQAPRRGGYPVNLLHVNADQTPIVANLLGEGFFSGRYTIGVWAWELDDLPPAFDGAFEWVDELWVSSSFIQRTVADRSPVPVVHMPYAVTVSPTAGLSRRHFALPDDAFLFLMTYDVLSVQERKNPLGAIEAFRQAFPEPKGVGLVLRVNHAASRPDDVAIVRRAAATTAGVVLFEQPMSRSDAQALQAACDALVSLHRSEGFGLNIAEAMLLQKPVIATAWSGNMDFTNPQNSCLVDYELATLSQDYGPYRKGSRWAEPDLSHAAEWMRRIVEDEPYRARIAGRAKAQVAEAFSAEAIGGRYRRRLAHIGRHGPWR